MKLSLLSQLACSDQARIHLKNTQKGLKLMLPDKGVGWHVIRKDIQKGLHYAIFDYNRIYFQLEEKILAIKRYTGALEWPPVLGEHKWVNQFGIKHAWQIENDREDAYKITIQANGCFKNETSILVKYDNKTYHLID
ncbi:hypothetical protein [Aureibacter tunicatorum]|uniref:Uncharacterized protein n=1 Tax=Aureibacter tunicatorum TaxID=866807 RepID=A0AAE4BTL8_9BACT|nr:hypothetical protein [Aureibacter tunicatorum]MDR6240821.1 hypothetical protein [Aureibacter tunicatorum]BDD06846.1 hypothetical protein AUTU_43290 [Aureibacter tunicatorum]